jgi:hypothetical protein
MASTMSPPMTGPSTGPSSAGTATTLMTRPMRCGPAARASMVCPTGRMIPPPIPWTTRKAIRLPADHAAPLSTEPARNSASDANHSLRAPKRSTAQPVSGMTIDSASR